MYFCLVQNKIAIHGITQLECFKAKEYASTKKRFLFKEVYLVCIIIL